FPSLAIGAIEISPVDADGRPLTRDYLGTGKPTPVDKLVVYAGTGSFSAFTPFQTPGIGLLRSTDGGKTWSLVADEKGEIAKSRVTSVVATGHDKVIVAALGTTKVSDENINDV